MGTEFKVQLFLHNDFNLPMSTRISNLAGCSESSIGKDFMLVLVIETVAVKKKFWNHFGPMQGQLGSVSYVQYEAILCKVFYFI